MSWKSKSISIDYIIKLSRINPENAIWLLALRTKYMEERRIERIENDN